MLSWNHRKTEIIVFGPHSVLQNLKIHGSFISESICVRFVTTVKNLGFRLDSIRSFRNQVQSVKTSSFLKLRNISKMKAFLNQHQLKTLIEALIHSLLDYCNSLYFGIDNSLLSQLQSIQNSSCRIIFNLKRRDSVSEFLQKLHWLKVRERIYFKILVLVYKCLNGTAPVYLSELLQYNTISGSRTPSLKSCIPKTVIGARAFQCSAPKLWNHLPLHVKQSASLEEFKK